MNDGKFKLAKQKLDYEIDKLGSNPHRVGVMMGIDLYAEFCSRGLMKDALADLVHWEFTLRGYRRLFVIECSYLPSDGYVVGNAKGPRLVDGV